MRVKAIPSEVASAIGNNKGLLLGGVALLAVGAIYIVHTKANNNSTNQSPGAYFNPDPVSLSGPGASAVTGVTAQGGGLASAAGSGGIDLSSNGSNVSSTTPVIGATSFADNSGSAASIGNGNIFGNPAPVGVDSATAMLFNLQAKTELDNFALQQASLNLQAEVAASNAWIEQQAITSQNFSTAAILASTFLLSPDQAALGSVIGPDGHTLIDFAFIQAQNSKKNGFDYNLTTLVNNGTFSNFYNETHPSQTTQPATSGTTVAPPNISVPFPTNNAASVSSVPNSTGSSAPQSTTIAPVIPVANTNIATPVIIPTLQTLSSSPNYNGDYYSRGGGGGRTMVNRQ